MSEMVVIEDVAVKSNEKKSHLLGTVGVLVNVVVALPAFTMMLTGTEES
jgi:hypothetical protein